MKPIVAVPVALLLLAGVGVAVYPAAHGSYVRRRATAHVRDAECARAADDESGCQTGAHGIERSVEVRGHAVEHADRGHRADSTTALVRLMASLKASPPPDNPIEVTAAVEPNVAAGGTVTVRVSVHSLSAGGVPRERDGADRSAAGLAERSGQTGLQPHDRRRRRSTRRSRFTFLPTCPARPGSARRSRTGSIPAGEGMDLRAQSTSTPPLTITRGPK